MFDLYGVPFSKNAKNGRKLSNSGKLARYKEIFPAPAKSDNIDSLRMLELFRLRQSLHVARDVLQLVIAAPPENDKLK